jgi:CelD/BcsL family acetyltransferase involved in cellulose biosynthesis
MHGGFSVDAFGAEEMENYHREWADLADHALEPNAFLEPVFALSAARLFPERSRPQFVVVWKEVAAPSRKRLMALLPIVPPGSVIGNRLARAWLHKQAALATPLLDRQNAAPALDALLGWFDRYLPATSGLVFPKVPRSGPFYEALVAAAQAAGRETKLLDEHERAAFLHGDDPDEAFERASSRKAFKELQRRRRRLEQLGRVEHWRFTSPEDIRQAVEDFLALEASGWKQGRGALLSQASLATFFRGAVRLLAREGKCQIHSLTLDGRPLAMGVVLESAGRAYFWKIAYDEAYRSQAPGVELIRVVTNAQTARVDLDMTDSCAIANHPMIDRVWPGRIGICDIAVELQTRRPNAFSRACRGEAARRRLRAAAKDLAIRLLRRKVS